ncbi:hypothetical protein PJ985_17895 [Streptomyces sp. ACA25]|uniref:hypothetical protein n=1 Tax=Streptomyces sp. ACA25 TaxID=3022596 RepID=UPI0023080EC7|nr:hypothetical protein [Streptomyces sp. ACA25]MDB1089436.1 hypothetical protein [Streptomyces sp. ACA25]
MTEQPTTPAPPHSLSPAEAAEEARRLIADAYRPADGVPAATSWRDHTPFPTHGTTPPVPQPDSRLVPPVAAGIAVCSIAVGAGAVGVGCGAWLLLQGLSAITLAGVLAVFAPFAGIAIVAAAVGTAVSKARAGTSTTTHVYEGHVTQHTRVETRQRGMFSRTTITR